MASATDGTKDNGIQLHARHFSEANGHAGDSLLSKTSHEHSSSIVNDKDTVSSKDSWAQKAIIKANELWLYELFAAVISLACMLGIIITLREYDGKPSPRWPWRININALIAILTVLLKGTMIFVISQGT